MRCVTPCSDSIGTEAWVDRLQWSGLPQWQQATRKPLYAGAVGNTCAFVKTWSNFAFYWIMAAGHMVPSDNAPMALRMLQLITGAPNA